MAGQGQTRSGASRILSGDLGMKRVVRRRLFVPCDDAPRAPCPRALRGQGSGCGGPSEASAVAHGACDAPGLVESQRISTPSYRRQARALLLQIKLQTCNLFATIRAVQVDYTLRTKLAASRVAPPLTPRSRVSSGSLNVNTKNLQFIIALICLNQL